jgi:hypothetical protein
MEAPSGTHVAPRQIELLPLHESTLELMPQALQALLVKGWMLPRMLKMLSITADMEEARFHDCNMVHAAICEISAKAII